MFEMSMPTNIGNPMINVNRNPYLNIGDNVFMNIGERVREARKEKGMTQKDLASKVGITQPTLSDLEKGESTATSHIAKIASALEVSPLWLETGRGPKFIEAAANSDSRDDLARALLLMQLYMDATDGGRELIISTAQNVAKRSTVSRIGVAADKS